MATQLVYNVYFVTSLAAAKIQVECIGSIEIIFKA
jgi:hypothetical protein